MNPSLPIGKLWNPCTNNPMKQSELAPGILVALPNLQDPYFSKTAILLCNYNEEGAFGLVMNHPSDLKVTEILKEEFQNHNHVINNVEHKFFGVSGCNSQYNYNSQRF